ncbi:MAG: GNAT family protein [Bacillota bacterium]|nr:GNAT family protein [Bacillota bacterium]
MGGDGVVGGREGGAQASRNGGSGHAPALDQRPRGGPVPDAPLPLFACPGARLAGAGFPQRERPRFIIQTRDGRPIGVMGLHRIDQVHREAELGIFIGEKDCWGRGYGTDAIRTLLGFAFEEMNFHRTYLRVNADNLRAQRCYEKCGFVREGTLRQAVFADGGWRDQHLMAALADEFRQN